MGRSLCTSLASHAASHLARLLVLPHHHRCVGFWVLCQIPCFIFNWCISSSNGSCASSRRNVMRVLLHRVEVFTNLLCWPAEAAKAKVVPAKGCGGSCPGDCSSTVCREPTSAACSCFATCSNQRGGKHICLQQDTSQYCPARCDKCYVLQCLTSVKATSTHTPSIALVKSLLAQLVAAAQRQPDLWGALERKLDCKMETCFQVCGGVRNMAAM